MTESPEQSPTVIDQTPPSVPPTQLSFEEQRNQKINNAVTNSRSFLTIIFTGLSKMGREIVTMILKR